MSAVYYMFGVFVISVFWSAISSITRAGASREIDVRGIAGVGLSTIRVANGTATASDKIGVIVFTILGSLVCYPMIIVSAIVGGILYLVIEIIIR